MQLKSQTFNWQSTYSNTKIQIVLSFVCQITLLGHDINLLTMWWWHTFNRNKFWFM